MLHKNKYMYLTYNLNEIKPLRRSLLSTHIWNLLRGLRIRR